jgi:HD-GYP domain-containing protein (c-di-GMP phosphodiesterase class II)
MREVPRELWGEVFDLVTEVLLSDAAGDTERFAKGFTALRALYARQEALGKPEPALTEALADYTDDATEAAALYRVAIAQSASYPDEPTHTKRICLASRLIDLGDIAEARSELALGRADAERLKDAEYVKLADRLLSQLANG